MMMSRNNNGKKKQKKNTVFKSIRIRNTLLISGGKTVGGRKKYKCVCCHRVTRSLSLSLSCPTVMFVCCSPDVFRKLMVQFRRADLAHEEYVFFYIDVFGDSLNSPNRQPWERGDEDDADAKEAFQVRGEGGLKGGQKSLLCFIFIFSLT